MVYVFDNNFCIYWSCVTFPNNWLSQGLVFHELLHNQDVLGLIYDTSFKIEPSGSNFDRVLDI